MLFNSYIFICILLPLSLAGWFLLNHFGHTRIACVFLTAMSLWFYGYFRLSYLFIIISSIAANYIISLIIDKISDGGPLNRDASRLMILISVCVNLGIFLYFKYTDFIIENLNLIFKSNIPFQNIVLPLGISFFTFQQLSYIIDRCKGEAEHCDLIYYATFVTFFPQLIAGPIVTHDEMIPQFKDMSKRRPDRENFRIGIRYFIIGFAKKVLLADILAGPVNYAFTKPRELEGISVIIVMLMYMFELYFDFSGYCDMAQGAAKMFNIDLPVNFNSPYLSASVKELWQRWHITLSRFFTKYVYIPLGGSRRGYFRMLLNVFIVFLLSGFWHGAAWTYVLWGVVNGIAVVLEGAITGIRQRRNLLKNDPDPEDGSRLLPKKIGQIYTFIFFLLSLCFFRSSSVSDAFHLIGSMFKINKTGALFDVLSHLEAPEFYILKEAVRMKAPGFTGKFDLILALIMLAISFVVITRKNSHEIAPKNDHPLRDGVLYAALFMWCFVSLGQVSTFLYFNF